MNNTAYYKTLGIESDATADDLKRAYRKLARKYHPDVNKADDAEERFKEMKAAYDCLKNPESRAAYDHYGEHWKAAMEADLDPASAGTHGARRGPTGSRRQHRGTEHVDWGSLFDGVFWDSADAPYSQTNQRYGNRGEDIHARMQISIEDSFSGATRQIEYPIVEFDGDGRPLHVNRKLDVKIPQGITAGQRIRLNGQGQPTIRGGKNGDLYVEIAFAPHATFEARGRDIYSKVSIVPWQAALGDTVEIETLGGLIQAKVPAASSSGKVLRFKRRGLPGKMPGDHYVELAIDTSDVNTGEKRRLYEQLRDLDGVQRVEAA